MDLFQQLAEQPIRMCVPNHNKVIRRVPKKVKCNGITYNDAREASEKLNVNVVDLRRCCNGDVKFVKGLNFEWIE